MPMQNRRPPSKYLPPRPHPTCGQGGGCYHIVLLEDKDKNKNEYLEHSYVYSNDAKRVSNHITLLKDKYNTQRQVIIQRLTETKINTEDRQTKKQKTKTPSDLLSV